MSNRETNLNLPKTEIYYFDEENGTYKPLASEGAIPVIVVGGAVVGGGGSTMNFLSGSGVPSNDIGASGDVYLNSVNGDLYKKSSSTWSVVANLKGLKGDTGSTGATGASGATWLFGASAPISNQGKSGDFYLNTTTYDIYNRGTSSWTLSGNIKGAKGDKGDTGNTGATGANGFGTEAQYNDIIARLEALEQSLNT